MTRNGLKRWLACAAGLLLLIVAASSFAQTGDPLANDESAIQSTPSESSQIVDPPMTVAPKDPESYQLWVLAPAVVAILLAILLREAIPALAIGVLVGGYMMIPCLDPAKVPEGDPVIDGLRLSIETYFMSQFADSEKMLIVVFTLTIGAMVGVIGANGGTRALVNVVARRASTSRRGQVAGWLAGMLVFFDDYANSMIIGPTFRPMFDRLKISRAKLSYIVDSTAAPIASIALIGTWLGAELKYIQIGLDELGTETAGAPIFLSDVRAYDVFLQSIPYRFYPIFALWMVLIIALTGRDFGPMKRSESRALAEKSPAPPIEPQEPRRGRRKREARWWLGAIPILVLVLVTVGLLYFTGARGVEAQKLEPTIANILKNAASYESILYGAFGSLVIALFLTISARVCSLRVAMDGAIDGMARMLPAMVILVLAWSLSQVSQDLMLGKVMRDRLLATDITPEWLPVHVWLPLIVFICAATISFATGTSWATMGILTPAVVHIAAGVQMIEPMADEQALIVFYAAVGSVLAGSIFGDHCSPISDTTVLSSVASSCRVEEHVWTQMPYAVVVAFVSMGAGIVFCMYQQQPAWMGLLLGAAVLFVILLLFGRRPKAPPIIPRIPPETLERRLRDQSEPPAAPIS